MTKSKSQAPELSPSDIAGNLESALVEAVHLSPLDAGAVALARRLSLALNVAFDEGDLATVGALAPKLLGVLQELKLTAKSRGELNGEQTRPAERDFAGDYLRLINSKN